MGCGRLHTQPHAWGVSASASFQTRLRGTGRRGGWSLLPAEGSISDCRDRPHSIRPLSTWWTCGRLRVWAVTNKASVDARGRASRGPALLFVLDTRLQAGRGGARLERSEQGRAVAGSGCTVSLSHRLREGSSCFGITLQSKPTRHPPPAHHTHRGCPSSSESRSWAYELRDSASTQPPSPPPPPPHAV